MHNPFKIFLIKRDERWLFVLALLLFIGLNVLMVGSDWNLYSKPILHGGSWSLFTKHFEMSGYDCWSWLTLSEGRVDIQTLRHPLYTILLYPLYWLNHWLMTVTGINFATPMIATFIVLSATYAAVFFFRICHELVGLGTADSCLLTALLFSFAHVMIPCMVPDHFAITLFLLMMTMYIVGKKMMRGRELSSWQGFLLSFFSGGIASSNVAKIYIAGLFANGRKFFRPRYLLIAVVLPVIVLLSIWKIQYYTIEKPFNERVEKVVKDNKAKYKSISIKEAKDEQWKKTHRMKSVGDSGILKLFDFSTPRLRSVVDNYFGEGFQLHDDHALEDELIRRPEFISYSFWGNYAMEVVIVLMMVTGIVFGFRHRLYALALSWWALDFTLNIILGFAINEVYIMTSGWACVIPLGLGYAMKRLQGNSLTALKLLVGFTAAFLWAWNMQLIVGHLL